MSVNKKTTNMYRKRRRKSGEKVALTINLFERINQRLQRQSVGAPPESDLESDRRADSSASGLETESEREWVSGWASDDWLAALAPHHVHEFGSATDCWHQTQPEKHS